MSEKFADLGAVAVLDPHLLKEGAYMTVHGQVCQVEHIIDSGHVYLTVVKGRKLFMYRLRHFWHENRFPIVATIIIEGIIALAAYFHIERLF